jgi:hypothetical protein
VILLLILVLVLPGCGSSPPGPIIAPTGEAVSERVEFRECVDLLKGSSTSIRLEQGWYGYERNEVASWRWIDREAKVSVKQATTFDRIEIDAFVILDNFERKSLQVEILVEGTQILWRTIERGGHVRIVGKIPIKALQGRVCTITIRSDQSFVPDEILHNGDTRRLSLMISRLCLSSSTTLASVTKESTTPKPSVTVVSFKVLSPGEYVWLEGESFVSQSGSNIITDHKPLASNGQCLGAGWGGREGDFAEYEVDLPFNLPLAVLYLRYAREGESAAVFDVYASGKLIGASPSMLLKPTGGWGYKADEWAYQKLPLGSMEAGKYSIKFVSLVDFGEVNIDGFFIADESFAVPRGF